MNKTIKLTIRLAEKHFILLENKARENGCTMSNVAREAIVAYLYKDVVSEDLIIANLNHSKKIVQNLEKKLDAFAAYFNFWVEYYFQNTPDYPEDKEVLRQIVIKGMKGAKNMTSAFTKTLQQKQPAFLENLLVDFIESEGSEK